MDRRERLDSLSVARITCDPIKGADSLYTRLDAAKIVETADRLARRIEERFPGSGLSKVATELLTVAGQSEADAALLAQPNEPIRVSVAAVLAAGAGLALIIATSVRFGAVTGDAITLVQAIESGMNVAILVGLGVLALTGVEARWKRRRALKSLHRLRSLAHIIDMHQLTKDPSPLERSLAPTASSPRRVMSEAQLERHLNYCSEMLSLVGKLSALYAQSHQDQGIAEAVNDIEMLTMNLSRKIWQKIAIIDGNGKAPAGL